MSDLGWHAISGELLLQLLRRAAAGENPDLLYLELVANAAERIPYDQEDEDT